MQSLINYRGDEKWRMTERGWPGRIFLFLLRKFSPLFKTKFVEARWLCQVPGRLVAPWSGNAKSLSGARRRFITRKNKWVSTFSSQVSTIRTHRVQRWGLSSMGRWFWGHWRVRHHLEKLIAYRITGNAADILRKLDLAVTVQDCAWLASLPTEINIYPLFEVIISTE